MAVAGGGLDERAGLPQQRQPVLLRHRLSQKADASAVGLHQPQKHLHEGTLARTVASHDAHLLVSREAVIEVLQYYVLVLLAHIFGLEYPAAYIG